MKIKCVNCGETALYIYGENSLCEWCFELSKLYETGIPRNASEGLEEDLKKKVAICKYWINLQREATDFHYPKVIE